ncbi:MAG: hypothetical protein LUE61_09200, partial [Clostridiales bacterium]|nr:hypothetical protein [Clostridiales bacterium]
MVTDFSVTGSLAARFTRFSCARLMLHMVVLRQWGCMGGKFVPGVAIRRRDGTGTILMLSAEP